MSRTPLPNLRMIRQRAELLSQVRRFFDSRHFLEVQPPCLSGDCIVDAYIDPIEVSAGQFRIAEDLSPRFFLQTSPEAAMKRMLAAGAPSIYSLGPVFRAGERSELHNTEFTMLEWYEVDADMDQGIALLGDLAVDALGCRGYDVISYRELFREKLELDPLDADLTALRDAAAEVDGALASSMSEDRDALLDVLLSQRVQPSLGYERPLIVKNYPLSQAALARTSDDDDQCAARFELFAGGIELANGYDELRDADVLVARAEQCNAKRTKAGRPPLPTHSMLTEAMRAGLPQCAGVALGFDRLLMVRTRAESIEDVLPFPIEIA